MPQPGPISDGDISDILSRYDGKFPSNYSREELENIHQGQFEQTRNEDEIGDLDRKYRSIE